MELCYDAVPHERHYGRGLELTVCEQWRLNDDIGLFPFTKWPAGVDERRCLGIDGSRVLVGRCDVIVVAEDLDFVLVHQKYAAVAQFLIRSLRIRGNCPFKVDLSVTELGFGLDIRRPGIDRYIVFGDVPLGDTAVRMNPLVQGRFTTERRSIERNFRVRRWCPLHRRFPRIDLWR